MPLHDWAQVPAGLFHDFHQSWSIRIKDALNSGLLPSGLVALVEQRSGPVESDVLAIETGSEPSDEEMTPSPVAIARPETSIVRRSSREFYARRANRIVVRHHLGRIVSVIEIVSPGNKDSRAAFREFVDKTVDFLRAGVHVLIIDAFPPTTRDPDGLHKAIWDEIADEEPFAFPDGCDRLCVSYENESGGDRVAYVEPMAVGGPLPDMPLFVTADRHALVPLGRTYEETWTATPREMQELIEAVA